MKKRHWKWPKKEERSYAGKRVRRDHNMYQTLDMLAEKPTQIFKYLKWSLGKQSLQKKKKHENYTELKTQFQTITWMKVVFL